MYQSISINPRYSSGKHLLTLAVVMIVLIQCNASIGAIDPDPDITSKKSVFTATWDFSAPDYYTLKDTTIRDGQLGLGLRDLMVEDNLEADFLGGASQNVIVKSAGSIQLSHSSGIGFSEITKDAKVEGTSEFQTRSVTWGDYNNDGLEDIFLGPEDRPNVLFKNNGDGTFTDVALSTGLTKPMTSQYGWTSAWGDFNNDGNLDLVEAKGDSFYLWRNNGNETFTDVTSQAGLITGDWVSDIGWIDYNNDGNLDIYQPLLNNPCKLWRNDNFGAFTNVGPSSGLNDNKDGPFITADVDRDGWMDVLRISGSSLKFFRNMQDGSFSDLSTQWNLTATTISGSTGFGVLDYNNDGNLDIYVMNSGQDLLFVNKGNTFWEEHKAAKIETWLGGNNVIIEDFDLNGYQDVFITMPGGIRILANNGDGTFSKVDDDWVQLEKADMVGAGASDYDNDGDKDVYIGGMYEGKGWFYRNDIDSRNYIKVKLEGNTTNIPALGARMELYRKETPDVLAGSRVMANGNGRGTVSSYEQIFGADSASRYRLNVTFLSGKKVTVNDIQPPAFLVINESGYFTALPTFNTTIIGDFISRPISLGKVVSWGNIDWTAIIPPNGNLTIRTRTSLDGKNWTNWSEPYLPNDQITSPTGDFIQYRIDFICNVRTSGPEVFRVVISYSKYLTSGEAIVDRFDFGRMALGLRFTSQVDLNGQSISFFYSKDGGVSWLAMPSDGDLTDQTFMNITLKAELSMKTDGESPVIRVMAVQYELNNLPQVELVWPANGTISGSTVTLSWKGLDLEGHKLLFDLYLGTSYPGTLIASDLSNEFYSLSNLSYSTNYIWYIIAKDSFGVENSSMVWSFRVNTPPVVALSSPQNGSTLNSTNVHFYWVGCDNETDPLTYNLLYMKDMRWHSGFVGINLTDITISLENNKDYSWVVVANDSMSTTVSPVWTFSVRESLNHAPIVISTPGGKPPEPAIQGKEYKQVLELQDPDGDKVTVSFIPDTLVPPGMVLTEDGQITWTPQASGTYVIGIQLTDDKAIVNYYLTIVVLAPNQPPHIIKMNDITLKKETVTIDLSQYVIDDGNISDIKWSITGGNLQLFSSSVDGTILKLIPVMNTKGQSSITITAKDKENAMTQNTINVTVDSKTYKTEALQTMKVQLLSMLLIICLLLVLLVILAVMFRKVTQRNRQDMTRSKPMDRMKARTSNKGRKDTPRPAEAEDLRELPLEKEQEEDENDDAMDTEFEEVESPAPLKTQKSNRPLDNTKKPSQNKSKTSSQRKNKEISDDESINDLLERLNEK